MSDFVPRDIIPELWDEILKRHWTYLDTEESIQKLEERKKLESCLKELLCVVQHDRKFFLPETAKVLKNSLRELSDFSAQKAIMAFESISQYANNLFTKPWRKEFRILKMYSGFYQHEIKSNLLDAEKLFEAMGYRRLSDDTLILDGPICPDQVTNVSRDAMAAYVELQIMKHIYTGLDAIGINCSWLDIYRYREKYTGGTSQAIKALAYAVEEKRYRNREKALAGDNYGYIDVQPSPNYSLSSAQYSPAQCQCNAAYQQLQPPPTRHRPLSQTNGVGMCCIHDQQQQQQHHPSTTRTTSNLMYSNLAYPAHQNYLHHSQQQHPGIPPETGNGGHLPQMSHSRSLEHYSEPANHHHNMLPHRHSFDHQPQGCSTQQHQQHQHYHLQQQQQQQLMHQHQQHQNYYQHINQPQQNFYESPYDCIDGNSLGGGSSTISYAAVAANAAAGVGGVAGGGINCNNIQNSTYSHPYNVSGNRFPLPLNISNQFSTYDNLNTSNSMQPTQQEPTYAHVTDPHTYATVSKLPQNGGGALAAGAYNQLNHQGLHASALQNACKDSLQRQRSYQTEQLIHFTDPPILPPPPQQQFDPYQPQYQQTNRYNMANIMAPTHPPASTACQQHYGATKVPINDDMYVYAKPTPRENRKPPQNVPMDKSLYPRKTSFTSGERGGGDTTDLSYESANDDFINIPPRQQNERCHQRSPTQFTKNQDGVGSFESWDFVFQKLDRSGYSKDLGEREDLLVQSLDLDSLNINNETSTSQTSSAEKRRSNYAGNEIKAQQTVQQQEQQPPQSQVKQKARTFERSTSSTKNNTKMELIASASSSSQAVANGKQKASVDNNKKIKSALKQTNATSKTTIINPATLNKIQPTKANDNKSLPKTTVNNNNNNALIINPGNAAGTQRKKSATSSASSTQNPQRKSSNPPTATQIIVTSPNEWSCRFCTFLNPNTKRICEMCCRTKDYNLDASNTTANSTVAAGGSSSSVGHNNTPTCV